jgi:putative ABC transport system ATP-binding protein
VSVAEAVVATALVETEHASVTYGKPSGARGGADGGTQVHALREVDVRIAPGERVALWGRSGSGKTTLLHLLGGLVPASSGSVIWKGAALTSLDDAARRRVRAESIAFVFQGSNLLAHLSAFENVAFARSVRDAAPAAEADGAAANGAGAPPRGPEELMALVGLSAKLDALPSELSGGEAQRVAIARALAQRPQLLLCDEPTGHLDSDTAVRVLDLLDAIQREFGFALVLATHDPDVAARAERVIELSDGRVVAETRL